MLRKDDQHERWYVARLFLVHYGQNVNSWLLKIEMISNDYPKHEAINITCCPNRWGRCDLWPCSGRLAQEYHPTLSCSNSILCNFYFCIILWLFIWTYGAVHVFRWLHLSIFLMIWDVNVLVSKKIFVNLIQQRWNLTCKGEASTILINKLCRRIMKIRLTIVDFLFSWARGVRNSVETLMEVGWIRLYIFSVARFLFHVLLHVSARLSTFKSFPFSSVEKSAARSIEARTPHHLRTLKCHLRTKFELSSVIWYDSFMDNLSRIIL